jgi:hypothetical protein
VAEKHNWKQRMLLAVLPPVGALVFRLLGATLKFEDIGAPGSHADDHPETRVWCLWHRSLLSIGHHFRKRNIAILISPSFDGELIAAMIGRVGYTPVRGSSSRGGAAGLLGMQRALEGTKLRSWDGFLIPKPFSTIVIGWQPPVAVAAGATEDDALEAARLAVEQALERARREVEEHIARKRGKSG